MPARRKDDASSIQVTIMNRTTLRAFPAPYSETFQPSRAADRTAIRTGLGTISLVRLDIHRLPSGSLVPQHVPERGPARVMDGLGHLGASELSRVHVTDDDQTVLPRQIGTGDVKVMPTRICDLGMDRFHSPFVSRALRSRKRRLMLSIVLAGGDHSPVAARRQPLEAEVYADSAVAAGKIIGDLTLERDVPAPPRVLHERARLERSFRIARPPESNAAPQIDHSVVIDLQTSGLERNPPQRTPCAKARPESGAASGAVTRGRKLSAHHVHRIGVQTKLRRDAGTEIVQLEGRGPSRRGARLPASLSFSLGSNAEIPDSVRGYRLGRQGAKRRGNAVLNSESVGDEVLRHIRILTQRETTRHIKGGENA